MPPQEPAPTLRGRTTSPQANAAATLSSRKQPSPQGGRGGKLELVTDEVERDEGEHSASASPSEGVAKGAAAPVAVSRYGSRWFSGAAGSLADLSTPRRRQLLEVCNVVVHGVMHGVMLEVVHLWPRHPAGGKCTTSFCGQYLEFGSIFHPVLLIIQYLLAIFIS